MSSRPILSIRTHRTLAEQLQSALSDQGGASPVEKRRLPGHRHAPSVFLNTAPVASAREDDRL